MKEDITFYYTRPKMVEYLLSNTPIENGDSCLDAGSGRNMVWYKCLEEPKFECEYERGQDYYEWDKRVDWIVGNPPYSFNGKNQIWNWFKKSAEIADKGFGFLINHQGFASITPNRLSILEEMGFYFSKMIIVQDKRWFGRYYYVIFTKDNNDSIMWNKDNFVEEE